VEVDHTNILVDNMSYSISLQNVCHYQRVFSAMNEEHEFLSQRRSSLIYVEVASISKLSCSNKHGESVITSWICCCSS